VLQSQQKNKLSLLTTEQKNEQSEEPKELESVLDRFKVKKKK
jgi:hypothetical protein